MQNYRSPPNKLNICEYFASYLILSSSFTHFQGCLNLTQIVFPNVYRFLFRINYYLTRNVYLVILGGEKEYDREGEYLSSVIVKSIFFLPSYSPSFPSLPPFLLFSFIPFTYFPFSYSLFPFILLPSPIFPLFPYIFPPPSVSPLFPTHG